MSFVPCDSAQRYGEIIYWQDHMAAKESWDAGRTVHADHGLQILHIQRAVYAILRGRVCIVLKDIIEAIESGN